MPTEPIRVACASDANYALPLAVMLASLRAQIPRDRGLEVFAMNDGIPAEARDRIRRAAGPDTELHWIPAGALPSGLVTWGHVTLTTYQKVHIAEWVPAPVGRVLWLDADLLICRDPMPLWSMPFAGNLMMAAVDERLPFVSSKGAVAAWQELGLDPEAPHCNAGVMLIDLDAWRREGIAARCFEYLRTYAERVYYCDQEAFNVVLAGRWGRLDPRWNCHPGLPGSPPPDDPFILHFSGKLKPWSYRSAHAFWDAYYEYLDRTPWSGWRPPRTWRGSLTARYQSSRLRRLLYPAEGWAMGILRAATATYSRRKSNE